MTQQEQVDAAYVIRSTFPTSDFVLHEDGTLDWYDKSVPKPTQAELDGIATDVLLMREMTYLRAERNAKLAESDWTQYNDSPLDADTKTAWTNYRQALRDLPENTADPTNITWPEEPEL